MNDSIQIIPFTNLALAFIPVAVVIAIIWKWQLDYKDAVYAICRMLAQLLLIGYVLTYIFASDSALLVSSVLTIMIAASSWIALRTLSVPRQALYLISFISITFGGGIILLLITQFILELQPWYMPNYVIPLAGMLFANAMNSVSLAGERIEAELNRGLSYEQARIIAFKASLIPITNSLFAVGLVSLPGMMTGQILSGVSPLIAVRYQIMVMCMLFGSSGVSSALFLTLIKNKLQSQSQLKQT
ncbi:ABC transporter permease [Endozoicomonas sp. SM1973]|uniref:ABC transporter permease n=1 Tax=Spartinivicinus marinus TaxID=2994442 RepID=A0A853I9V4_9GAMM|nr:ABC transporter permease [Spartinivicinus marinus]MCX4028448.1 ABC transporter permease [Spartinivicinus marinus]NYZ67438.1 ABC transporter permease [Spartinivicinus marinus]